MKHIIKPIVLVDFSNLGGNATTLQNLTDIGPDIGFRRVKTLTLPHRTIPYRTVPSFLDGTPDQVKSHDQVKTPDQVNAPDLIKTCP